MSEDAQRPTVVLIPAPQTAARIFTEKALATLSERYRVIDLEHDDRPGALDERPARGVRGHRPTRPRP